MNKSNKSELRWRKEERCVMELYTVASSLNKLDSQQYATFVGFSALLVGLRVLNGLVVFVLDFDSVLQILEMVAF